MAKRSQDKILCITEDGVEKFVHFEIWEPEENINDEEIVICVHGLTRNGSDFDFIAEKISRLGRRTVCVDVIGRGKSDWLENYKLYGYSRYTEDIKNIITHIVAKYQTSNKPLKVYYIGTSMGGLIGMMIAKNRLNSKLLIDKLVINDVGPYLPATPLNRLATYVGKEPVPFPTIEAVEVYLRHTYEPFGLLSDATWRKLTESSVVPCEGGFKMHYDPNIARNFGGNFTNDVDLFSDIWSNILEDVEIFIIRGVRSDIFPQEILERMLSTYKGKCSSVTFPHCGHAPMLADDDQANPILSFLFNI